MIGTGVSSIITPYISGFDLKVEGNTDLKGGLITSEAEEDKNQLETGTLAWSDLSIHR